MKKILDYGCGNGEQSIRLAGEGMEVIGIDKNPPKISFLEMDCEKMDFSDESFDMIFDRGTLHYVDREKAFPEMARILKPQGTVVGTEVLRHNPVFVLYRKIRWLFPFGSFIKRKEYGIENILGIEDFEIARRYFKKIKLNFCPFFMGKWAYKVKFILEK